MLLIHKTGRVGQVVSFRAKRPCWTYGWGRVKAEIEESKRKEARDSSRAPFARDGIACVLKFISTSGYFALQVSLTMVMERTIR